MFLRLRAVCFYAFMTYLVNKTYQRYNQNAELNQVIVCNVLHRHLPLSQGATVPTTISIIHLT